VLVDGPSGGGDLSLGYAASAAATMSRDLLDSVSTGLGLLVVASDDRVGFIHRYLQEYLRAEYLLLCGTDVRRAAIVEHLDDANWREVIANCLQRLNDEAEMRSKFERLDDFAPIEGETVDNLAAAVAFGHPELGSDLRQKLADRVFPRIEHGERLRHRLRLIGVVPDALRSSLRSDTLRRLSGWIWGCGGSRMSTSSRRSDDAVDRRPF